MNSLLRFTCALALALPAAATNVSFQGAFSTDDQIQLFNFSVTSTTTVTLVSLAYGGGTNSASMAIPAGGFDSFFTLFSANGTQINTNNDGACGVVNSGNGGCLDAYLSETVDAGSYILALTESGNNPAGNLADGFIEQGQGNFTCVQGFCDAFGDHQNGSWAVDIRNVQTASTSATPEPSTLLLAGGFLALFAFGFRQQRIRSFLATICGVAGLAGAASAQTVPLTQDSYVVPQSATNFGSATTINVGGSNAAEALVQFDLTTLGSGLNGANVAKATLTLFASKVGSNGSVNISVANGPWSEATVSGTSAPPVPGAAVASGVPIANGNAYVYADATAAVQGWLNGAANNGFIITPVNGVNVAFDSKESATTSHPATLSVILTSMGPAGAKGATGPQGPPGAMGLTGPAGPTGTSGIFGFNAYSFVQRQEAPISCVLGDVKLSASTSYGNNWMPANGTLLPITEYTALFSLLGNNYGGDGRATFGLPDLRKAAPNNVIYLVCISGVFP